MITPADKLQEQAAQDAAETQDEVELDQHVVMVTRDPMMKVPTTVLDHEIPILIALHGEENVAIVETRKVKLTNVSPGSEYDRLTSKYEKSSVAGVVQAVYGNNPSLLAEDMGLPYQRQRGARVARKAAASLFIDHENPQDQDSKKSEVRRAAITTPAPKVTTMTKGIKDPTTAELNKAAGGKVKTLAKKPGK